MPNLPLNDAIRSALASRDRIQRGSAQYAAATTVNGYAPDDVPGALPVDAVLAAYADASDALTRLAGALRAQYEACEKVRQGDQAPIRMRVPGRDRREMARQAEYRMRLSIRIVSEFYAAAKRSVGQNLYVYRDGSGAIAPCAPEADGRGGPVMTAALDEAAVENRLALGRALMEGADPKAVLDGPMSRRVERAIDALLPSPGGDPAAHAGARAPDDHAQPGGAS